MTAAWMIYGMGISALSGAVGWALERALDARGNSLRPAWMVGIAAAVMLPASIWLLPGSVGSGAGGDEATLRGLTSLGGSLAAGPGLPVLSSGAEDVLAWLWVLSSALVVCVVAVTELGMARGRRRWRPEEVDGLPVLVSPDVGPAVAGLLSRRIVLPEWAFRAEVRSRSMIVRHETEHVRARDPLLIAFSLLVLALAPWNLPLWWMHRRLRQAIEIDCDRRVLRHVRDPRAYGMLLLDVARYSPRFSVTAAALAQTPSTLRRRVRHMMRSPSRPSPLRAIGFAAVALAAALAACELPAPSPGADSTVVVLGRGEYRLDDEGTILGAGDLEAALRRRAAGLPGNRRTIDVLFADTAAPGGGYDAIMAMNAAARAGFTTARQGLHRSAGGEPRSGPSVDLAALLAKLDAPQQADTVETAAAR